jgi:phage baseplate assembly protein W
MFPAPARQDYAFPFRVDPTSRQTSVTPYAAHINQLIRQLLLTAPGERVNLPQFGCGLGQLVYAPTSDALLATLQIRIRASLQQWLGTLIEVADVTLAAGGDLGPGAVEVTVTYRQIETQTSQRLTVTVM